MKVLLDTCAILWAVLEPEKLSKAAKQVLEANATQIFISPISATEVACGAERGRISLNMHWKSWLRTYINLNGWGILPIDMAIAEEAYSLPNPFHADPADRILAATARIHRIGLVTGDRKLIDNPHVDTVW